MLLEAANPAIAFPQFHIAAVDELPGLLSGLLVIDAHEIHRAFDVTVTAYQVRAVMSH
jgi:hypothetical protein